MDATHPSDIAEIEKVLSDRDSFNAFVYTPWQEALEELEKRRSDGRFDEYLGHTLPHGIPEAMQAKKSMVLFRHLATPNFEIHRFLAIADALTELSPLILEYAEDKFNDRNITKYFLGKLCFQKGLNKNGEPMWESLRVIDFNGSNNKPITTISTLWGESLVDFHHQLFLKTFPEHGGSFTDISQWLRDVGPSAKDYYKTFLSLFVRDGILFENFFLDEKELPFTKNVVLPALLHVMRETGIKPLIVALAPTDIEGDEFWHSYPHQQEALVKQKLQGAPRA